MPSSWTNFTFFTSLRVSSSLCLQISLLLCASPVWNLNYLQGLHWLGVIFLTSKQFIFFQRHLVAVPITCLFVLKAFPGILWRSKLQNISMRLLINYNSDSPQCFLFCHFFPPPVPFFFLSKLVPGNWICHRISEVYWRHSSTQRNVEADIWDTNKVSLYTK